MRGVIWSDIHESVSKDGQGGVRLSYNADSVKTSLNNILGTNKGERCMRPNFGASLEDFLFENFDEDIATRMTDRIKEEVTKWDQRINILSVTFNPDIEGHLQNMNVIFTVVGSEAEISLDIPIGS